MPKPTVYITHKIPQAALDIIAAHCDYTMWEDEATPVPHDVLLRSIVDVDGV
ncbi:MAG: D-glycerate dehydrogenase [Chloroflexi bacterium AL-W]|nr:D-glycerate dehydrogenase [Chloroflexi bacterium AL-N1]NOK67182.1 D-glycerate dehydrogenase [Chloroflexi bacterium AL-N10]NOK75324.1 D-glycerate dehydrogenase [Chloroflexi bacterium AL-N5]NOK82112.1 D-glycerate dehydrogenase [Chloroflexi bacterium AL-W]NOK89957.1 D-glycerate dehydrogenase [Chloroflexi bacterium AL-N15]